MFEKEQKVLIVDWLGEKLPAQDLLEKQAVRIGKEVSGWVLGFEVVFPAEQEMIPGRIPRLGKPEDDHLWVEWVVKGDNDGLSKNLKFVDDQSLGRNQIAEKELEEWVPGVKAIR